MKNEIKLYTLDGDTVSVSRIWDEEIGCFVGDYPNFKENPRFTPSGRKWVNVTYDECPFAEKEYSDCGSCRYFKCERKGDMIGICTHPEFLINEERKDA